MLVTKELKKLFQQLLQEDIAHITVAGSDITIRIFDKATQVSLSTEVYFGGNFIPKSVRSCLDKNAPFAARSNIKAFVTLDENAFRIYLNYLGRLDNMNDESFRLLLEDFSWLADEWRLFLDEHDKNDLIHVNVKR